MRPDKVNYNPDPSYLRELIALIGLSQSQIAEQLGVGSRMFRHYLTNNPKHPCPYPVQFCLEIWAREVSGTSE
jgi:transcriptional regulator with XRE-family HTH domain